MTTTWAAKVLEGVARLDTDPNDYASLIPTKDGSLVSYDAAIAAIARMGAGDGLVERISEPHDPGDFVGDIFYGHPIKTTMGTHRWTGTEWVALPSEAEALAGLLAEARKEAAAHIAALTAQNRELALDVLASSGQAADAYAAQLAAEAERDALRDRVEKDAKAHEKEIAVWAENYAALERKVARLEGALRDMPKAVLHTTVCQGPQWPDDRPGVWLAALEACAKSVQAAVDAAIGEGGKDD